MITINCGKNEVKFHIKEGKIKYSSSCVVIEISNGIFSNNGKMG